MNVIILIIVSVVVILQIINNRIVNQTNRKARSIMKTQDELKVQVDELTAKVVKITTETQSLLTKIQELLDIIASGGNVSPELQAAVDTLSAQVTVVDELVPDVS